MTQYHFEQLVDRTGTGSLKGIYTPPAVTAAGLPSFWGAEFDFPTCPAFSEGVMACAKRGFYPFTLQTEDYNSHVRWWLHEMRNWDISDDWIVPTHGTIFALATAIRLTVPTDCRMIVLEPGYSRYTQAANRLERQTVHCHMAYDSKSSGYTVDFTALENVMSDPKNTLLVFSNPNNPTGQVLGPDVLAQIDTLSRKYGVTVFCDEIFAETMRPGKHCTPYGSVAAPDSPAITCTSLGKCMSLTGVNHANVLIPNPELRERYIRQRYADHYGSIDPMLYAGLLSAYTPEGAAFVREASGLFAKHDAMFREAVERILPGTRVTPCDGAFLAWVNYEGTGKTAAQIQTFLETALFLGDPGEEYDSSPFFYRYSLAMPTHMLEKALNHLEACAREYSWPEIINSPK